VSTPLPTYAGGHLGALVAPLVDGQLRPSTAERAWAHVLRCQVCADSVRRQTWVKNQLLLTNPAPAPASLAERLCALPDSLAAEVPEPVAAPEPDSWPRGRVAAAAGLGGLSAAALMVASLVGLPAVSGPGPVEASLNQPAASPRGSGSETVDAVWLGNPTERTRRVGLP
jgi:hypothetical protein